jgi:hypothetical protein
MATNISKKRKVGSLPPATVRLATAARPFAQLSLFGLQFIADGVFYAELNELLTRELAEDGYSGVEVRQTPMRTEIIIRATRTQNVLGEQQLETAYRSQSQNRSIQQPIMGRAIHHMGQGQQ